MSPDVLAEHLTASNATKNSLPLDSETTSPSPNRILRGRGRDPEAPRDAQITGEATDTRHAGPEPVPLPSVFSVANQRWLRSMAKSRRFNGLARGPGESRRLKILFWEASRGTTSYAGARNSRGRRSAWLMTRRSLPAVVVDSRGVPMKTSGAAAAAPRRARCGGRRRRRALGRALGARARAPAPPRAPRARDAKARPGSPVRHSPAPRSRRHQ